MTEWNSTIEHVQEVLNGLEGALNPEQLKQILYLILIVVALMIIKIIDIILNSIKEIATTVIDVVKSIAEGTCCIKKLIPCL